MMRIGADGNAAMRALLAVLAAAMVMLVLTANPAAAQCTAGRINGSGFLASGTYDPFAASDSAISYTVQVRNTSATAFCDYGLVFRSPTLPAQMGTSPNLITYTISSSSGGSNLIITTAAAVAPALWIPVLNVARNTNVTVTYWVNVPRGQVVPPGTYNDPINIWLYALNGSGVAVTPRLHNDTLTVRRTVPTSISVNIAGGGTTTTLDYGALTTGEVRSVNIEARSNVNYQLQATALNLGNLTLAPPYSSWTIPYTATLGGSSLNLTTTTTLGPFGTTVYAGTAHALAATVGTVGTKRAGIYSDEITIVIQVAP